jgi:hypothetical protein
MNNNLQDRYRVLSTSKVGIEFEFYTNIPLKELTKNLSRALIKKVVVPVVITGMGETSKAKYHSEVEPTATMFKLEKDFSGGKDMYEMITGPLPYEEARLIIIKMNEWIKENGWTNDRCAIHLNVSFNDFKARLKEPLMNLNVLKFILSWDEEFIYSRFPVRRNSVYAKSIDDFYPINRFVFYDTPANIDNVEYHVPNEKYYGINFTKLVKNYLECRYVGGANYHLKTYKILEVLDYFVEKLYYCLDNNTTYNGKEIDKLYKQLKAQKKVVITFSDTEKFNMFYPDIHITVDMKNNLEIIKSYWITIREKLYSLIVDSGLREGYLNLDTDVSTFQLRDGVMEQANHISDVELFDCKISGTIENCDLYRCEIENSRLTSCKLFDDNVIKNSKISHTLCSEGNILDGCYVENPEELIDCKMEDGIIRKGIIGKNAQISKETLIIDVVYDGCEKKDQDTYMNAFGAKKDFDMYSDAFSKK